MQVSLLLCSGGAFVEDIISVDRTTGVLRKAIIYSSKAAKEMGLTINLTKMKYMAVTKRPSNLKMLKVVDQEFEMVREFI
jgi:nicotinamide mononucleotide (NMN) deamidase PncC